jgi:hypothetical protein
LGLFLCNKFNTASDDKVKSQKLKIKNATATTQTIYHAAYAIIISDTLLVCAGG